MVLSEIAYEMEAPDRIYLVSVHRQRCSDAGTYTPNPCPISLAMSANELSQCPIFGQGQGLPVDDGQLLHEFEPGNYPAFEGCPYKDQIDFDWPCPDIEREENQDPLLDVAPGPAKTPQIAALIAAPPLILARQNDYRYTQNANQNTSFAPLRPIRKIFDFSQRTSSKSMQNTINTTAKPYICQYCSREFTRKHDMNRHVLVHLKIKDFACDHCGRAFARNDAMKKHMKRCPARV